MRSLFVAAAVVACAGSAAVAQTDFRLDLSFVARQVNNGVVSDLGSGAVNAVPGSTYRVELRYRIADLKADNIGSRGLTTAQIRFATSGTGASAITGMTRSTLTNQQRTSSTPLNPDASGLASGFTGLIGPFRTFLPDDSFVANGTPSINPFSILPVSAFGAPNHYSWTDTTGTPANPSAANTNAGTLTWALYSFDFTYNGGQVAFSATPDADPTTGNSFQFFTRTGSTNNTVPITSQPSNAAQIGFTSAGLVFVPAPGAASLLALGGLLAARRARRN